MNIEVENNNEHFQKTTQKSNENPSSKKSG